MTNNDILRRLRYALSISNDQMVEIFAKGNLAITHAQLHGWLAERGGGGRGSRTRASPPARTRH